MLLPHKAFLKSKKMSGASLPASFSARLWIKNIALIIFYQLTKCYYLVPFREVLSHKCFVIICELGFDVKNFEIKFIFQIKPFSVHDQKVKTKI